MNVQSDSRAARGGSYLAYQSFMPVQCSCMQPVVGAASAVGMAGMSNSPSVTPDPGVQTPQLRRHALRTSALASHCSGVTSRQADAGNSSSQSVAPSSLQTRGGGWEGECGWSGEGGAYGGGGGGGNEISSDHESGAGFVAVGEAACLRVRVVV